MIIKEAFDRVIFRVRNQGFLSLVKVFFTKTIEFFVPPRSSFQKTTSERISEKKGLEIGGPSSIFSSRGFIPVYKIAGQLDNMNFASETIWEGEIRNSSFSAEGRLLGTQYIGEASDLSQFTDSSYDFILSSEMIQHIANPLKALYEWKRVLKEDGLLILIVPNMEKTFDHRRPLTSLEHMADDYRNEVSEADMTHLEEALKYHDLSRDRPAGTYEQFRRRSEDNFRIRALHHHVFNKQSAEEFVTYAGFNIISSELFRSTIVFMLEKKQ